MINKVNHSKAKAPARGYIEGYFGRLLSFTQREQLVNQMSAIGASFWLYAPKEDPYHRIQWRSPYSKQWLLQWQQFNQTCSAVNCNVIAGLAAGLSIDFSNPDDRTKLLDKYQALLSHGANSIALLMDDIEARGQPLDAQLALQQLELLELLGDRFSVPIYFCPSIYCSSQINQHQQAMAYLETLSAGLKHTDIKIFWTGSEVVSLSILPDSLTLVDKLFGENYIIWDNFYANDYAPWQIRLAPLHQRSHELSIGINPTGLFFVDQILLEYYKHWHNHSSLNLVEHFVAVGMPQALAYLWDKYYQFDAPEDFQTMPFFSMTAKANEADLKLLIHHLQHWVDPMKIEFYPFFLLLKKRLQTKLKAFHLDNL